jgi:hypothetical protein
MTAVEETAAQPFITGADPAVAFTAFATSGLQVRAVGAAVLAGLQLARSANTPGLRMAAHDRLAQRAGATDAVIAPLARPTPEFLGLFSKIERLALIQPHVDAGELRRLGRLRDRDLSRAIADRLAQLDWVHPLLSFEPAHPEPVEGSAPADAEARTEEHA